MTQTIASRIRDLAGGVVTVLWLAAGAASADGTFLQLDLADRTSDAVVAATRGDYSLSANRSSYRSGWSAGAAVTRDLSFDGIVTLKVGPSIGRSAADGEWTPGLRVVAERYLPTSFGFAFASGQYDTVDDAWFGLAQFGNRTGYGMELTAGGSDAYSGRSVALTRRLGEGPVALRAGYRLLADEAFVGLSINTY